MLRIKTLFNPSQLLALHKTGTYALGRKDETWLEKMKLGYGLVVVVVLMISKTISFTCLNISRFIRKALRASLNTGTVAPA